MSSQPVWSNAWSAAAACKGVFADVTNDEDVDDDDDDEDVVDDEEEDDDDDVDDDVDDDEDVDEYNNEVDKDGGVPPIQADCRINIDSLSNNGCNMASKASWGVDSPGLKSKNEKYRGDNVVESVAASGGNTGGMVGRRAFANTKRSICILFSVLGMISLQQISKIRSTICDR